MASARDPRSSLRCRPLYEVPPPVHFEFCRVMDELPNRDWTKFASEVLRDITAVRLAAKKEHRTDTLMHHWQNRNGSVGELLDLLQKLELLRPWDIINTWASTLPPLVTAPPPFVAPSWFDPPPKALLTHPPVAPPTCAFSQSEMAMLLPKPQPPELRSVAPSEVSSINSQPQPLSDSAAAFFSLGMCTSGVMAWAYEEVHAGTRGFSDCLKIGEGGFGEVYRASLRNMDCAVKRFKKDCSLDWSLLRDSFKTEVEKLSKFRHTNIIDLLGYTDGGGTYCLIYSFMKNRALDDQLRSVDSCLSWSQRVSIVTGAARALQYLHCPPEGQTTLVHGDVKSSNILLDASMEAKLADFGLARFMPGASPGRTAVQTRSLGKTQEVRGTLAYLPEDYIKCSSKLSPAVDVYGFGVVLLEILTGRRALENDKKTGQEFYLKDLIKDIGSDKAEWRKQLDKRLLSCGAAEPAGFMQVVSLAQCCCSNRWKKRPTMEEVYKSLKMLHNSLHLRSSSSSLSLPCDPHPFPAPGPPLSLDSCLSALSLSTKGPSENADHPRAHSLSPPQSLLSSTVSPTRPPHGSASPPPLASSFHGPCETDESRGYSQFVVKSNGLGPELHRYEHNPLSQPSVPTEDQYNFSGDFRDPNAQAGGFPQCGSPAESLLSGAPVVLNPSKQRLFEKISRYEQGLIHTPELLSSEDPYSSSPAVSRQPEESDELEYLQPKKQ